MTDIRLGFLAFMVIFAIIAIFVNRNSLRIPHGAGNIRISNPWKYKVVRVIIGLLAIHTILWYFPPLFQGYRERVLLNPQYILMGLIISLVGFSMFPGNPKNPADHKIGRWAAFAGVLFTAYLLGGGDLIKKVPWPSGQSASASTGNSRGTNNTGSSTPATWDPPFTVSEDGWRKTLGEWMAAHIEYPEITEENANHMAAHCAAESGCSQYEPDGKTVKFNHGKPDVICKMQVNMEAHGDVIAFYKEKGVNFDPSTEEGCMAFSVALVRWDIAHGIPFDNAWKSSESNAQIFLNWLKNRPAVPVLNIRSVGGRNTPSVSNTRQAEAESSNTEPAVVASKEVKPAGPDLSGCEILSAEARPGEQGEWSGDGKYASYRQVYLARLEPGRAVFFKAGDYIGRIPPDADEEHPWLVPVDGPFNMFFRFNVMSYENLVVPVRIYGCE